MNILVTGSAGFIGFHLSERLVKEGFSVTGIDNLNDYYSTELKYGRLRELGISKPDVEADMHTRSLSKSTKYGNFRFIKVDLSDRTAIEKLFEKETFDIVINLAAQAGVRYSLDHPHAYTSSNVEGFLNILEGCRKQKVSHLIFASSSSVYGTNKTMPFKTTDQVDRPVSLYAATKKANELMAHAYSHLYGIPVTGLRFFTVYGEWGRPDMAYFKFADLMRQGKPIDVYNHGKMSRDFTYIDDIVESIVRLINKGGAKEPEKGNQAPYQLFNIGNGAPVNLLEFIEILEKQLGMKAEKRMMSIQPGDVEKTWADVSGLYEYIDYKPRIGIEEGIARFVEWYKGYYSGGG